MSKRRAVLLQKVGHFLTAFTVLMKAITKLEHPAGDGETRRECARTPLS